MEDFVHRPLFHDTAEIHHDHIVGHLRDHAQVVRDEDDRGVVLLLQLAEQCRICACVVTSIAVVGSSAMSNRGLHDSAMAIIARCRRPPDNCQE